MRVQRKSLLAWMSRAASLPLLWTIRLYQTLISPLLPPACRFYPSCSAYFYQAVEAKGPIAGTYLGIKRLLRCHPFNRGGCDPVA